MLIFVYGTLKRGEANHGFMGGQRFVGEAVTMPLFRLYDLGGYPGMIANSEGGTAIQGELWEVDAGCLERLDELEDIAGGEYVREGLPLAPPHADLPVQGYRYLRSVAGCRDLGGRW